MLFCYVILIKCCFCFLGACLRRHKELTVHEVEEALGEVVKATPRWKGGSKSAASRCTQQVISSCLVLSMTGIDYEAYFIVSSGVLNQTSH